MGAASNHFPNPHPTPTASQGIYPVLVRASGFNFSHNVAMGILGGLTPLVVTSIEESMAHNNGDAASSIYSLGVWLAVGGVSSVIGLVALQWKRPQSNFTREVWLRKEAAAAKGSALQAVAVVA